MKPKPVAVKLNVPMPVNVPMIARPVNMAKPNTPYEVNKLFNEMKNSNKPFMTIKMKAPAKQSMFPDPFNLFDVDNRYIFFVGEIVFIFLSPTCSLFYYSHAIVVLYNMKITRVAT